jgi:hypothetical protein
MGNESWGRRVSTSCRGRRSDAMPFFNGLGSAPHSPSTPVAWADSGRVGSAKTSLQAPVTGLTNTWKSRMANGPVQARKAKR